MPNFFNYRYLLLPLLTCLIVLGITSKTSAQNLSVYPSEGVRGQNLTVTISSPTIYFQQSSPTVCPNQLKVNASNVIFQQGSSTIYPTSVTTNNGVIEATIQIPQYINTGTYNLFVGLNEDCPTQLISGFNVTDSYLSINPNTANRGTILTVNISGTGVDFHQGSPTVCPSHFDVNTSNVTFRQGSSTIYPSNVTVNNGQVWAQVSIPSDANGYYDVVVGDINCNITKYYGFYVSQPTLTVSPSDVYYGQTLNVTIAGTGINFVQGSPTICPSQLNVTTSNVYFKQGTSTIYPNAISTDEGIITAQITIPYDAASGYYDLIAGNGEGCTITKNYGLNILSPYIQCSGNTGITGSSLNVVISGYGLTFNQGSSTLCPNYLNVTTSNVVFKQGSYTIYPSEVSISNNHIIAKLNIPINAPTGYYTAIVGYNEGCSYTNNYSLNIQNPSLTVYPTIGSTNQHLTVSIVGQGINFYQGSTTICPNNINLTTADIVFRLGNMDIFPTSFITIVDAIEADIYIPPNAPIGNYELIIGENNGCPLSKPNAFTVRMPTINAYLYSVDENSFDITITGNGVNFTQESITNCPFTLNVNSSSIYVTDGTTTIHPNSVNIVNGDIHCSFNYPILYGQMYDVVVGDQSDCPYSAKFEYLIESNSNNQSSSESITKIYPNPSYGSQINLEITKQGTYEVTIINPYGQAIGMITVNGPSKITLPEILSEKLNPGMYLININDGKKIQHEKLIIE